MGSWFGCKQQAAVAATGGQAALCLAPPLRNAHVPPFPFRAVATNMRMPIASALVGAPSASESPPHSRHLLASCKCRLSRAVAGCCLGLVHLPRRTTHPSSAWAACNHAPTKHPAMPLRSECVINTLEGPGISTSECPACHKPGWKNDLRYNHKYNNLVEQALGLQAEWQKQRPKRQAAAAGPGAPGDSGRPAKQQQAAPLRQQQVQEQQEKGAVAPVAAAAGGAGRTGGSGSSAASWGTGGTLASGPAAAAAAGHAVHPPTSRKRSTKPRRRGRSVPDEQPPQQQQEVQQATAGPAKPAPVDAPAPAGQCNAEDVEAGGVLARDAAAEAGKAAAAEELPEGSAPITPQPVVYDSDWEEQVGASF